MMKQSRRRFLKTATAASALLAGHSLLGPPWLRARPGRVENPLMIPPRLTGTTLSAAAGRAQIFSGAATDVYTMNGLYPSPTIEIDRGEEFAVRMENRLPDQDLVLHWHGILAPSTMDGHPHMQVPSGEDLDYRYMVEQRAGTYWYHPHTDPLTGPQVYFGLAGFYLVHDEEERGLPLPTGKYDVPLMLQDRRVSESNELLYDLNLQEVMIGWQGDTMLVNGTADPVLDVERTRYRFRLLNGANARVFLVGFSDGRPFHLIANDGGLLSSPVELDSFYLGPGERGEILVDFSDDSSGESVVLETREFEEEFFPNSRQGRPAELIRFNVGPQGPVPPALPTTLATIEEYDAEDAARTREFRLHMFDGKHAINDLIFEPMRVDFEVPLGELEIWRFTNSTQIIHPMHVHGVQFQVLDRNGSRTNVRPEEQGWKDTVLLFPTSTVRVLIRFTAHAGLFMLHCHNLEHEDDGMMQNFLVVPDLGVGGDRRPAATLRAAPNITDGPTRLSFAPATHERRLEVTDLTGRTVMHRPIARGAEAIRIDLIGEPGGTYLVRVGAESVRIVVV